MAIGIEIDCGLWVDADRGRLSGVCDQAVGGNALPDRHHVSGAKSDTGDAKLLADLVRTDRHNHRPIAGDSDAEAIKVLARAHQNLTWARTRHTNALRSALREYYPAALRPSRTWPTAMPWVCWAGPPLQLRVLICPRAVAIRGDPPNSERRGQLGHRLTGGRKSAQLRLPIPD